MATPRWDPIRKRWQMNAYRDGCRKTFTSTKASARTGPAECRKKSLDWQEGFSDKSHWRLDRCWALYLEDVKARTSYDNYDQREQYGRLYVVPRLGLMKMNRISDQDWQDCITKVKSKSGKLLSKKSLANLRGAITDFWRFAKKSRMIDRIPDALELPTNAPVIGKDIIRSEQIQRLFAPCDAWYVNAWRLMVVTGLRPGECYGLQRDDISNAVLTVRRSINWRSQETKGKNTNAAREMALNTVAEIILMEQAEKVLKKGIIHSPWIFPDKYGDQPSHRNAYAEWVRFAAKNHITVSPYCLRHTFVSLAKDIPEATLKRIVGHSKNMDTHGTYDHKIDGELQRAADTMDNAFGRIIR